MAEALLTRIQRGLANYRRPVRQAKPRQASVACVLRGGPAASSLEMLFIRRAARDGDRWSGQVAFPGGKADADDASLQATAERETLEEIGLDLRRGYVCIGQSADRDANPKMSVSCFVFHQTLDATPPLTLNKSEVSDVAWVKVERLADPKYFTTISWAGEGLPKAGFAPLKLLGVSSMEFKAIDLGHGAAGEPFVLWGLTHRLVGDLLDIAEAAHPQVLATPVFHFSGPLGWLNNAVLRSTHATATGVLGRPLSWNVGMKLHMLLMYTLMCGGAVVGVRCAQAKM